MRILFLSQRFLLPMDTGGKIRTGNLLAQLSQRHEITLVSNYEAAKDAPYLDGMARLCARFVPVPWTETRRYSLRFFARLALQLLSRYPVNALNDYSRPLERALLDELANANFDVLICDFVQSALLFHAVTGAARVLFQHNVESMIPERHMRSAGNPAMRLFWWLQWRKLLRFEAAECRSFDTVIAVSDGDRRTFEKLYALRNLAVIPTGTDIDHFRPQPEVAEAENDLVFCGSMDWLPNEDGVAYFLDEILPLIKTRRAAVRLTVVGRNPSPRLCRLVAERDDVTLTGWVEDTRPHLAAAALCIVPLRIGGGTRMKIYEAMAMGKVVVSTSIGAEGLEVSDGTNIVLADRPEDFAARCVELLADASRRHAIARAARTLVEERFSWSRVADEFERICANAAANNP